MQRQMDYAIGQMTTFFDILSSRVDARFAKLTSRQKRREIIRVMKEYGFVKYPKNSVQATRKLILQLYGIREEAYDIHPQDTVIMKRAMTRILQEQEYVNFEDRWDLFRIRLADIFEYEYKHCLRWMRSDLLLLENKDVFSRQALLKARTVLVAAALRICAADMNTRIHERAIKIRKRRLNRALRSVSGDASANPGVKALNTNGTPHDLTHTVTKEVIEAQMQQKAQEQK
jgi:hypothetical protein